MRQGWLEVFRSRLAPWILLLSLWAVVYLTRLGEGELVFEEGRRATPAREMLRSGDFVVPRLYGEVYLNKPPVFCWLVAFFGVCLGEVNELAVRLPSVLSALIGLVLLYRLGRRQLDRPTRLLGAFFALGCVMFIEKGRLGEIDMFLSVLVLAALSLWWDGYEKGGPGGWAWLGIGVLLGIAILTKGPAGPLLFYLPVATFLLWQGQTRQLFRAGNILCVLVSLLPTLIWVGLLLHQETLTWDEITTVWRKESGVTDATAANDFSGSRDLAGRVRAMASYLGYFLIGSYPAWPAFLLARRKSLLERLREEPLCRLLVCAIVPALVFVMLWPVGRPRHAMFICYPICLLAAMQVMAQRGDPRLWPGWLATRVLWLTALVVASGALFVLRLEPAAFPTVALAVVILGVLLLRARRWSQGHASDGGALALAANATLLAVACGFVNSVCRPNLGDRPVQRLRGQLRQVAESARPTWTTLHFTRLAAVDFNTQFYLGPRLQALQSLSSLPRVPRCYLAVQSSEKESLVRAEEYRVVEELDLGRLPGSNEHLLLLDLVHSEAVALQPGSSREKPPGS